MQYSIFWDALNILNILYSWCTQYAKCNILGCTQYAICNILGCTQYAWWPELSGEWPTAVHSEVYLVTFPKNHLADIFALCSADQAGTRGRSPKPRLQKFCVQEWSGCASAGWKFRHTLPLQTSSDKNHIFRKERRKRSALKKWAPHSCPLFFLP